jgi:hypothetical protein
MILKLTFIWLAFIQYVLSLMMHGTMNVKQDFGVKQCNWRFYTLAIYVYGGNTVEQL